MASKKKDDGDATASESESEDAGGSSAKKAGPTVLWQWQKPDKSWVDYDAKDRDLIEKAFETDAHGQFKTRDLSFGNSSTLYVFDFDQMQQVNAETNKKRPVRRMVTASDDAGYARLLKRRSMSWGAGAAAATKADKDKADKDRAKDKSPVAAATKRGAAAAAVDEEEEEEEDAAPAKRGKRGAAAAASPAAAAAAKKGAGKAKADAPAYKGLGKLPDPLPADQIKEQAALGAQSRRSFPMKLGGVERDPHGKKCFERMLGNEGRLCGEWAVMYHSYSYAALLYEVQAAVAAVLFRFKSTFASLPRLLKAPFNKLATADDLMKFMKTCHTDHNVEYRSVAICGTTTLLGPDPEAPPTTVFLSGYSCSDVSFKGVLTQLLLSCYVPKAKVDKLAADIIKMSEKHGLDVSQFGGKRCASGRAGHLLQIFMKRELLDEYVYAALPFGHVDAKRQPISKTLASKGPISGQVRICCHPSLFMRANCVRMFVYSADPTFHEAREKFQEELTALLQPILGSDETRVEAAKGIHGGELPSWYDSSNQLDAAKVANRFK